MLWEHKGAKCHQGDWGDACYQECALLELPWQDFLHIFSYKAFQGQCRCSLGCAVWEGSSWPTHTVLDHSGQAGVLQLCLALTGTEFGHGCQPASPPQPLFWVSRVLQAQQPQSSEESTSLTGLGNASQSSTGSKLVETRCQEEAHLRWDKQALK